MEALITEGGKAPPSQRMNAFITRPFEKPILAAALLRHSDGPVAGPAFFNPPDISFRAAALANLRLRALTEEGENLSFAWEWGTPVWLPNPKRKTHA
jgi:hypothetical protein